MQKATDYLRKSGLAARRIGAELAFLPVDAHAALRRGFPDSEIVDALFVLERLRIVKSRSRARAAAHRFRVRDRVRCWR